MAPFTQQITLPGAAFPLQTVVSLVDHYSKSDYYIYERNERWHIGLGAHASLVLDSNGEIAIKVDKDGRRKSLPIENLPTHEVRRFVAEYHDRKIFGQVGFNFSARCSSQAFEPSQWPMLSLMVPRVEVTVDHIQITVAGYVQKDALEVSDYIRDILETSSTGSLNLLSTPHEVIDVTINANEYKTRVANAITDIANGKYTKAIPSRKVPLNFRVDMLATLFHGRKANSPARTFSFNHMGVEATGFSPEVLLSIEGGNAYTEALAGTQESPGGSLDPLDNRLHNDAKEVMEHVIAVKGSIRRLSQVCLPGSIVIKDFMKVMQRGNVQHSFSHVCGRLRPDCDGWDALPGLIASITVPGIPGHGKLEAERCFEPEPRDLYCGAVLMLDEGSRLFDATLVLRTVFQDANRQWLQAGAGVTINSNPEREFTETCEKLRSVAPFVVSQCGSI